MLSFHRVPAGKVKKNLERRRKDQEKRGCIKEPETGGGLGDFTLQLTSALERDKQRRAPSETQEMGSLRRDHQLIMKAGERCRSAPREKHRHSAEQSVTATQVSYEGRWWCWWYWRGLVGEGHRRRTPGNFFPSLNLRDKYSAATIFFSIKNCFFQQDCVT